MQVAVAQAVGVLNTITVPMGSPPGTDSGPTSAEHGDFDHTVFGVIRDHASPAFYYRSAYNPSLQRVRLSDVRTLVSIPRLLGSGPPCFPACLPPAHSEVAGLTPPFAGRSERRRAAENIERRRGAVVCRRVGQDGLRPLTGVESEAQLISLESARGVRCVKL